MAGSFAAVVEVLRETARAAVGAEGIAVVLKEGDRCSYVAEDAVAPLWQGQSFPADDCVSGWTMRERQTVAISDVRHDPRVPQEAYAPTFVRSLVMAPIGRPHPVAALGAYWSEPVEHDAATVERLESLARLATIAIENATLALSRDRAAALSAAQNRILEFAVEEAPLGATLDSIVREVESLSLPGVIGSILLLDEGGTRLRFGAGPSLPTAYNEAIDGVAVGPAVGSCGTAVHRGEPVSVSDIQSDPLWADFRELADQHGLRACWSRPIRSAQGEILGTFAMYYREAREPLASDLEIVDFVVRTAGFVIARARTENDLRENEERLRLAVNNADLGFWDVDVVGDRLIWPTRTKEMFGISPDVPVTLQDFYDGLHPDDRDATTVAYLAAANPAVRALYDVEYRTVGKEDGVVRWVAAKGRGVFDASGRCLRVAGTALEITARKASEVRRGALAELAEALANLHDPAEIGHAAARVLGRTMDLARVGYAAIDHDAETLHVDRDWTAPGVETLAGVLALRDYGTFVDSLKGGEITAIGDVREDPRTSGAAAIALETKGSRSFVNVPVMEHGRLVAVFFVNSDAVRKWSEGDLQLISEFADRTRSAVERARGELALRESEARLRHLNETLAVQVEARSAERDRLWNLSQDMLARADYTGMMSAVSPAWSRVLGWSERELLTRGYATFMHPDDMPSTLEAIAEMAKTRRPTRFENRIGTSDGGWKSIEWTVAPEPDGVNFIAVGRDLSHAKAREAELERAQEALRQSQKMEAMGQLTGGVAHDFNNLLTPIVGSLDMLQRKGIGTEREQRLIAGAAQSAEKARTLVQRLLAFARRQPLQSVAVDVAKLVSTMGDLIESTTGPQIRVVVETDDHLPAAKADPNQLEMALLNLAVNARDAMPDGGTLRISATPETIAAGHRSRLAPGAYVRLSVADTGTGMDEPTLARAVEPFFSTKGIGKGTGLGLSMVHGLASQLGGALTIQSRPGVGTNIELWLPVTTAVAEAAPVLLRNDAKAVDRGVVMLVDDESLVRMSTADMLTELGYGVIEASSAEEAVRLLETGQQFDLVVTDHLMPGMTGTDLARHIGAAWPNLPVLLVSGYAEIEGVDAERPRLTKPFRKDELAATLLALGTQAPD